MPLNVHLQVNRAIQMNTLIKMLETKIAASVGGRLQTILDVDLPSDCSDGRVASRQQKVVMSTSRPSADRSERIRRDGSNVLGATGLSRQVLRHYMAERGLFGRDSELDALEQEAVAKALRSVPRTLASAANDPTCAYVCPEARRLDAIYEFASAAVTGDGTVTRNEWARATAAGLRQGQLSEVLAVYGLIKEIEEFPTPSISEDVRLQRLETTRPAANRLSGGIGRAFRKRMRAIFRAA